VPFTIAISSPDARFLHVYAPEKGGHFAAEPVSHANAALNAPKAQWEELGLRILAPGETMSLAMRVDVAPVQ
jgi:aldose 1-epimerase